MRICFVALLILFGLRLPTQAQEFNCKVISVHDGDTFTCSDNRKIRVWGVDAPEVPPRVKKEVAELNGGYIARDYLSSYILNQNLICEYKGKSYKRIVGHYFINGDDIALPLLKEGYAHELVKYSKGYYSGGKNEKTQQIK